MPEANYFSYHCTVETSWRELACSLVILLILTLKVVSAQFATTFYRGILGTSRIKSPIEIETRYICSAVLSVTVGSSMKGTENGEKCLSDFCSGPTFCSCETALTFGEGQY